MLWQTAQFHENTHKLRHQLNDANLQFGRWWDSTLSTKIPLFSCFLVDLAWSYAKPLISSFHTICWYSEKTSYRRNNLPSILPVGRSPEMSPLHVYRLFQEVLSQIHVATIDRSMRKHFYSSTFTFSFFILCNFKVHGIIL